LGRWSAYPAPHHSSGGKAQTDGGVAPITVNTSWLEKENNVNTGGNVGTDQAARVPGLQNWMYDATASRAWEVRKYLWSGFYIHRRAAELFV
jgi:hypothetical protein